MPKYTNLCLWAIILSLLAILFSDAICQWLMGFRSIKAVNDTVKPSFLNDCCVLAITALGLLLIDNTIRNVKEEYAQRVIAIVIPLLALLLAIGIKQNTICTSFASISFIKYIYAPILLLAFVLIKGISKMTGQDRPVTKAGQDNILLFDNDEAHDLLGRSSLVDNSSDIIAHNVNDNGSFGVAVTGGWGTGKSWFLKALQQKLKDDRQICVDFRPWLYDENNITVNFCRNLEDVLSSNSIEIDGLSPLINSLLKDIGIGGTIISRMFHISKTKSREEIIRQVKEEMGRLHKNVYVFMDDCDRLSKEEILRVFRVIRNVCDFPHLCFIMAYDSDIINTTLKDEGGLNYVSKMVNLIIPLPPITNGSITKALNKIFEGRIKIGDIGNENIIINFAHYLPTMREVKRFWNFAYSEYQNQKEIFKTVFINEADWVALELIKFKDNDLYNKLRFSPKEIFYVKTEGYNSPAWMYDKESDVLKGNDCRDIVAYLFGRKNDYLDERTIFNIANEDWYPLYFSSLRPANYIIEIVMNTSRQSKMAPSFEG